MLSVGAPEQYDSFGKPLDGLENITRFGYAGYERDAATGYYRTDTRWYLPQSGECNAASESASVASRRSRDSRIRIRVGDRACGGRIARVFAERHPVGGPPA